MILGLNNTLQVIPKILKKVKLKHKGPTRCRAAVIASCNVLLCMVDPRGIKIPNWQNNQGIRPHRIEITELINHQASTSSKGI